MSLMGAALRIKHMLNPSTPRAGESALYFKEDGLLYVKDSTGRERLIEPAALPSLFANPDFEDWTAGVPDNYSTFWQSGGGTVSEDTVNVVHGNSAAKFFRPVGGNARITTQTGGNYISVNPGDLITLSLWAKKSASSTGAKLDVSLMSKAGGIPGFFDPDTQFQVASITPTTTYNEYRVSYIVPAGHDHAVFDFNPYTYGSVDITVWVDNMHSEATATASNESVLSGSITMWPNNAAPEGYLNCDGTVYNIADHPVLAGVLGNQYGGDGTTTFAVPDYRNKFPIGSGPKPVGQTGGSFSITMPNHTHSISGQSGGAYTELAKGAINAVPWGTYNGHNHGGSTGFIPGANPPIDTTPPYVSINFIIKT